MYVGLASIAAGPTPDTARHAPSRRLEQEGMATTRAQLMLVAGIVNMITSCVSAAPCPSEISFGLSVDGADMPIVFRRGSSLFATARSFIYQNHLVPVTGTSGGSTLFSEELASRARSAFEAAGCTEEEMTSRFDILQVGAHRGDKLSDDDLESESIGWLYGKAPPYVTALLIEPNRRVFEDLVKNMLTAKATVTLPSVHMPLAGPRKFLAVSS